jgi:hypothetical protein
MLVCVRLLRRTREARASPVLTELPRIFVFLLQAELLEHRFNRIAIQALFENFVQALP